MSSVRAVVGRVCRLAGLVCVGLLVGCQTLPEGQGPTFSREGRFALKAEGAGQPPVSVQGQFQWQESASGWTLRLISPLGATLARLSVTSEGATLEEPNAPVLQADTADRLLLKVLQEPVPADAMKDWLKGSVIESRDLADVQRDTRNRIIGFRQAGWLVDFDRYDDLGPRLITVSSIDRSRTVNLRLVIDDPS